MRPDAAVQYPISPHKQGAVFDVAPLVCAQSGAATHRQKEPYELHAAVELDTVLYFRLLPSRNIPVDQKHPGG